MKADMDKLDMSWGSPAFLSPYWQFTAIKTDDVRKPQTYEYGSRSGLKANIKALHELIGNANVEGKHIVVAAGATQILLGLMTVLKKRRLATGAWANPPHFSRFPILAEYAGLKWQKSKQSLTICTVPNNPDGTFHSVKNSDILDLTYMWPQYTKEITKYNHPIMVFSLSKATGHASTRIGWAIIQDKEIAHELEQFIELSTSGLSIDAQVKAERVIESQLKKDFTVFEDGKKTLDFRWNLINCLKRNKVFPFKVLNNSGMFLWAEGKCPDNIISYPGDKLGGTKDQFRLNLGCSDEIFSEFIKFFIRGY